MTFQECPFTGQEYDNYRRNTYKHYDDKKIQELHRIVSIELMQAQNNIDVPFDIYYRLNKIEKALNEAEIPYENNYKNCIKGMTTPYIYKSSSKKKHWWEIWK